MVVIVRQFCIFTFDVYLTTELKVAGENDYYSILSVDTSADDEKVRKEHRKLALLLHPDKNKLLAPPLLAAPLLLLLPLVASHNSLIFLLFISRTHMGRTQHRHTHTRTKKELITHRGSAPWCTHSGYIFCIALSASFSLLVYYCNIYIQRTRYLGHTLTISTYLHMTSSLSPRIAPGGGGPAASQLVRLTNLSMQTTYTTYSTGCMHTPN